MRLRFFSKLTIMFVTFIVFSSCISFLSNRQVALAKPYNSVRTSRSETTANTEVNCAQNYTVYHAGGKQFYTADGAGGYFNQDMPSLGPNEFHSLAELAVESTDGKQIVEVGWNVDACLYKDKNPHLFVYHWVNGKPTCYNGCGFQQVSKDFYPGMKVTVDSTPNATHLYAIEFSSGNWWIWYQNQWVGYFPGTLWNNTFKQVGLTQWFGEVSTPQSQPFPCSQMGNGILGTNNGSAVINNMYFIVNGKAVAANEQQTEPTPADYDVGNFKPNSFTFGGPGDTQDCSQPSAANWPMFGYDATDTRYNPNEHTISPSNAGKLVKGWSALGGADVNSPVVGNGAVYIGGVDGKLYAFNATTGNSLWASSAIGGSSGNLSTAAATHSDVYVGSPDGHLYALSVSTGQTLWKYPTGGAVNNPTVVNGIVYFGSADQNMYAINASTGQTLWKYPTGGLVNSTAAVVNGVVYFSSSDDYLHAVNASTGKNSWAPLFFYCSPGASAVANNVVYVATACGDLDAINAGTGAVLWTDHTAALEYGTPAVANGVVYIGYTSGNNAYMFAFNATKQAPPLWSSLTDGLSFGSSPAVANGVVYIGSNYGSMYAFNAGSGAVLWKHAYGSTVFSSPVVANGIVYVGEFGAYLDTFHL